MSMYIFCLDDKSLRCANSVLVRCFRFFSCSPVFAGSPVIAISSTFFSTNSKVDSPFDSSVILGRCRYGVFFVFFGSLGKGLSPFSRSIFSTSSEG